MSQKIHLPFLDGIRGIAILAVFLFHCLGASYGIDDLPWNGLFRNFEVRNYFMILYPLTYGNAGVAVFFVVSGFCIHLSYKRSEDKRWILFANKRFFRIFPPYILAILVFLFVWPWSRTSAEDSTKTWQLLSHVLAFHNFDERTLFGINPSFWSIAVEVQLYAIYPLLVMLTKIGWRFAISVVGAIEIIIRLGMALSGDSDHYSIPHWVEKSPFAY